MQATVFFHPKEWQQVAVDLRSRISGGKANGWGTCLPACLPEQSSCRSGSPACLPFGPLPPTCSNIHVGAGINNAKLCGKIAGQTPHRVSAALVIAPCNILLPI
jgi:hypothetical protein